MKPPLRWVFSVLVLAALLAQPVLGFDYPLSSSAIREAYFLGTGDPEKRLLFFDKYVKRYPTPKSGQYVASIRFETPYYIIAERISQFVGHYSAPDAVNDYLGKPAICRVRLEIYFGYSNTQPNRYDENYSVKLSQHDKGIPLQTKWNEAMVSGDDLGATADGFYMTAEFNADDIDPEAPATVEVIAPDGRNVVEKFDLASLR